MLLILSVFSVFSVFQDSPCFISQYVRAFGGNASTDSGFRFTGL